MIVSLVSGLASGIASLFTASAAKEAGRVVIWHGGKGVGMSLWKAALGVGGVGTGGFLLGRKLK